MSDKYCCVTWGELAPELIAAKEAEINELISAKGLPRSVFASVFKVLNQMQNYCPVCGSGLSSEVIESQQVIAKPIVKQTVKPNKSIVAKTKCVRCNGRGVLGHEGKDNYIGSSIAIKCMNCFGEGYVSEKHTVRESADEVEHEQVIEKRIEEFEKQGDE